MKNLFSHCICLSETLTIRGGRVFSFFIFILVLISTTCLTARADEAPIIISLEQAINLALKNNRRIINAQNSLESAKLALNTRVSEFDIKIKPFAGGGVTDGEETFNSGLSFSKDFKYGMQVSLSPSISKSDKYASSVGLSLEVPLFRNFGELVNTESIKSARYSIRSAERALVRTQEDIVLETVTSYYNIVEQKKNVAMNRLLKQRFERHSAVAQIKTNAGLAQPLDIYRARIKEKDAEVSLTDSLENLQTAYNNLKSVLSIPQSRPVEIDDTPVALSVQELDIRAIENIAFQNSIEIKSALDNLNERKRDAKIAEHNLLPDLSVFFDYTRTGNDDDFHRNLLSLNQDIWSIYLTSSTDFARTAEKNSYRQSLVNVKSGELDLADKKDQLGKDVKNQVDFLEKTRERIAIIEEQIQSAVGKLELSRIKFDNGMADNFDMIEAETELHRAKLNHLSARIDQMVGTYRLRKTIGTLIAHN